MISCTLEGRNFGLKSWVPTSKENEAPLGPKTTVEENGRRSLPSDSWVWKSVMSSLLWVCVGSGMERLHPGPHTELEPRPKTVLLQFNLCRSPLTADNSKFFIFSSWKVGVRYPSLKSVGMGTPRIPVNYAYDSNGYIVIVGIGYYVLDVYEYRR